MKKAVCTNTFTGRSITFEYGDIVFLQDIEDIGAAAYENNTSTNTGEDGVTIEGESQEPRHPVIRALVLSDYDTVRDQIDAVFHKGVDGQLLIYRDDGKIRVATYRVEGWELSHVGIIRDLTVNLICADPLFYETEEDYTTMAAWRALATFPFTFHEPFAVSEHISNLLATITNDGGTVQALRIVFNATGEVRDPYITDVGRQETLRINTTMHNGDKITATTALSNMHITQTSGGKTVEITNLGEWPIAWLQLHPGENLYRYGAASGVASLQVQIWYRKSYGGA